MRDDDYMTLDEVLRHIMRVEKCSRSAAVKKFRHAAASGKLDMRWATDEEEKEFDLLRKVAAKKRSKP